MTDLNIGATVTDGGGYRTMTNPSWANDNDNTTGAAAGPFLGTGTGVPFDAILKSDLGSSTSVGSMSVNGAYGGTSDPQWQVSYSSDGVAWTPVTGFAHTFGTPAGWSVMTFDSHSARYWRIRTSVTYSSGIHYVGAVVVRTWEIFAGTPPDPPPPPDPGVVIDPDPPGDGGVFIDPIDLSDYVMSWRIQRGATPEVTGGASIGTCTVVLQNVDPSDPENPSNPDNDRFNPENASGPLYGNLRDGLPLWLGVNSDGALSGDDARGLFGGYTDDWTPILVPGAPYAPTVELTGKDALAWYGRTRIQVEDEVGRSQHDLRQQMLDAGGEMRYELANESHTMPLSSFDGALLNGLEAINEVNGTRHFCKPQDDRSQWYRYTSRNRQWRLDGIVDATLNAFDDSVTGITNMTLSADTVTNQQKATFTPVVFTPSSREVYVAEGLPWTIIDGSPKVLWIEFDDYVKDPAVEMNHTGGALTATLTSFGMTAKLEIATDTSTTGKVTSLVIRGQLARRGQDVSFTADDTDSQAGTRGVRSGSDLGPEYMGVLADTTGIARHVVWRYGTPQLRPQLVVQNWIPADPDTGVGQFDIDLYDTIAFTTAQGQITSLLFEVIGLTHEGIWAESGSKHLHITTYVLQECKVQSDPGWFVLDSSHLDGADVLAY